MKTLITGANGLLGQKLVALLRNHPDHELVATARGNSRLPYSDDSFEYREMDITNRQQVEQVIESVEPDAIIHTAAMTQVDDCESDRDLCWKLNVEAVQNLVDAAEKTGSFFVHLSTDFIFDGKEGPYDEEGIPAPVSYYGESKLASEEVVKNSNLRWAIARTVLVYGVAHDMSRSNIILWVKNSLESGKNIKVVTDQLRSPTLAEDLAKGCFLIATKKTEGIFNISGKDLLTPYEMAIKTADFFNLDKSLIAKADASTFSQPAKRPPKTGFIIKKAQEILGYQPHSFEEGIAIVEKQVKQISAG
ncbi:MAG TPA: NAD(P)-dependent oxidoreductase [Cytophagales bacterium]|jgi:dTDP-4-dehydrorhamnose reductase|nr:NAD(P)-dependent oxidoreductase [Cytophagales bacterium]